eukprot:2605516-Pyramimonas_sp.AAC.1
MVYESDGFRAVAALRPRKDSRPMRVELKNLSVKVRILTNCRRGGSIYPAREPIAGGEVAPR